MQLLANNGLRVAVEGCGHGTLHSVYASVRKTCEMHGWDGVDLLIVGGDFQAVRNAYDLNCVSMPVKYRDIGDFHEYYSGARTAPYLTIFVGGNHEASNYLCELYYGGWVAPNIYYLGAANVIRVGPLRIVGLSGIWKGYNYNKPHHERLPYNQDDVKSIYHVREIDTRKLLQLRTQIDVGISHDWPRGVEWKGNWKGLFRRKNHLEEDARNGNLGSVAAKYLLERLRPAYWFSAHLHIKYSATVQHEDEMSQALNNVPKDVASITESAATSQRPTRNEEEIDLDLDDAEAPQATSLDRAQAPMLNTNEIDLELDDAESASNPRDANSNVTGEASTDSVPEDIRAQLPASFARPPNANHRRRMNAPKPPPPSRITNKETRFLALDKCLPNRDFLQILDISPINSSSSSDSSSPIRLEYDKEWLAITRVFAHEGSPLAILPDRGEAYYLPLIEQEEAWVEENVMRTGKSAIPLDFAPTAPFYDPALGQHVEGQPREYSNPQTRAFCEMLQIPNPFHTDEEEIIARMKAGPKPEEGRVDGARRGGGNRGGGRGRGRGRGGRNQGFTSGRARRGQY